ncbi:FAD-dependent oxidoreductase [Streptomyces sp. CYG21]|uniref:FAD-dependent oxidoreductase n=1 Tax=Streptomyces sp. CYG21 TaxID=2838874 RepID=UPI001C275B15|nr:NAD(P)/FAD-dependent oxidoreductase [Streptomyces sp. CYG21]
MSAHTVARSVTVLGGGLAGLTVARELRAGGYGGAVRIVDPEGVPYDRPPLSKAYLEGGVTVEKLHLVPEALVHGVRGRAHRRAGRPPGPRNRQRAAGGRARHGDGRGRPRHRWDP